MVAEQRAAVSRPISVEPAKLMARTLAWSHSLPTIVAASPVTTLKTPAGMPARSARSARASAESGACEAGWATTVPPAASAAETSRVTLAGRKFQGGNTPQQPDRQGGG